MLLILKSSQVSLNTVLQRARDNEADRNLLSKRGRYIHKDLCCEFLQ